MNDSPTPLTESIPELEPDIPATAFAIDNTLMLVIIGLGSAVLLALFAYLLWRAYRKRCGCKPAPSPEAIALAELATLEEELPALGLRDCALRVSLILRSFLAGQAQDPALYETHEEFSLRMDALAGLPGSCQRDMRDLLETLAEQKYAAVTADDSTLAPTFIERARELVQRVAAEQAKLAAERSREDS